VCCAGNPSLTPPRSSPATSEAQGFARSADDHRGVDEGRGEPRPTAAGNAVAILVTQASSTVDVAIPTEVLTGWYDVRLCSGSPGTVALSSGISVEAPHDLHALPDADTVFVPGVVNQPFAPLPTVVRSLRYAAERRARIIGIGSGALVLAGAGLLRRQPAEFEIVTCRSGRATLDLCLELVGEAKAAPRPPSGGEHELGEILDWITAHLEQPLTLADMARAARMSPRTLARRFHATLGTTPIQWLLAQRIHRAKHLLETTPEPIERIARLCGFSSTGNFRHQFTRDTGLSPRNYRRRFRESEHVVRFDHRGSAPSALS
jgi:AraC family transcriptional regulator, transcriptional activator FtrA